MVSADPFLSLLDSDESGRISFSSEFLDESNFITICPNPREEREEWERGRGGGRNADFEFLSGNLASSMIAADELMSEGKLLPFWQIHHAEKLKKISLKPDGGGDEAAAAKKIDQPRNKEERMTWFLDEDPSPRPPKCTVLWKELLKLKKLQRPSTLSSSSSPSSSSSSPSSSSSSSTRISATEIRKEDEGEKGVKKSSKKTKKLGQERIARSGSIRIRPVLNVPICTQAKNAALPPLFSLRKARVER